MAIGPNFYAFDFQREISLQGKTTTFLTFKVDPSVLGSDSVYLTFYVHSKSSNTALEHFWLNGMRCDQISYALQNESFPTVLGRPTRDLARESLFGPWTSPTPPYSTTDVNQYTRVSSGVFTVAFTATASDPTVTYRLDFDGEVDESIKIAFILRKASNLFNANNLPGPVGTEDIKVRHESFGDYTDLDYVELNVLGFREDVGHVTREVYQNLFPVKEEIYEDRTAFALLRTNPKLSGNVKLTVDSVGSLWLNSIDANQQLSDSKYKKYAISANSSFQVDLYQFLDKGAMPAKVLFELYQEDDQYLNTKRTFDKQFDNFYMYGVQQLNSRFYSEEMSFFAPLWLRKKLPSYFVIFRVDHPLDPASYQGVDKEQRFQEFFRSARVIKTFDMRPTSKLGAYLKRIIDDPRFKERPLEVYFDKDVPSAWNGIDYQNACIASKGEFLYDYYRQDHSILEFEEYMTGGFERNGIICSNLINLEFLFNDEEAKEYSINRYFGFYVEENQLAEFFIDPSTLGKIAGQTPQPKPNVDGEPYSIKEFVQTNPNGIRIPIDYFQGNAPIGQAPEHTGTVSGKLALPAMVDDPLRIFYVKDREGNFKRVNKLEEVEYGVVGSQDYRKVTELQLFDQTENISLYGGVQQIVAQPEATLLNSGYSQLSIVLDDAQGDGRVFQPEEELLITIDKLNHEQRDYRYTILVTSTVGSQVSSILWNRDGTSPISVSVTYPFSGPAEVSLDNYITIGFDPLLTFSIGDEWEVIVQDTAVRINYITTPLPLPPYPAITVTTAPHYEKFQWKMIANEVGIPTGDAWKYPVYDPDGYNNLSHFNPVGTPTQVASAVAKCINSFDNRVVNAWAQDNVVYLKSTQEYELGNQIKVTRNLVDNAVHTNMGFYKKGLVATQPHSITNFNTFFSGLDININPTANPRLKNTSYYIELSQPILGTYFLVVREGVDPNSPSTTGVQTVGSIVSVGYSYSSTEFNFTLTELSAPFAGSSIFFFTTHSGVEQVNQMMIGGVKRHRSRASVSIEDGQRFYDKIGNSLSISKKSLELQQWFQIQRQAFSLLKAWDVQGEYVYALPYLEEPIYGRRGQLTGFDKLDSRCILQVNEEDAEFYYDRLNRLVSYSVYMPKFGIFSLYPVKSFDTDTFFSEYSYTPTPEVFRYYDVEKRTGTEHLYDVDLFENYELTFETLAPNVAYPVIIELAYQDLQDNWQPLEAISVTPNPGAPQSILLNTYYPIWVYNPHLAGSMPTNPGSNPPDSPPPSIMMGQGYYTQVPLVDAATARPLAQEMIKRVTFLIRGNSSFDTTLSKYNYKNDKDLETFQGFAGLQDFVTDQDLALIQQYKAEQNLERFTVQLLLSEYDRLRENFNKDWAVKSKVVPYIQKWVQEGTDARDNYYRLNTSQAFGLTNLSPDGEVQFTDPLLLTHEFPYLDTVPAGYPDESLEGSRSYFFSRLSDRPIPGDTRTWYELFKSDLSDDWFGKYFSVGYPTEKVHINEKVLKSREERFTFFNYEVGLKRSQTLFRGGKVQILELDPALGTEIDSTKYDTYRFAAIARVTRSNNLVIDVAADTSQPTPTIGTDKEPFLVEVIKNENYKTIVMVITIHEDDYRLQTGRHDYLWFYAALDQLRNICQVQTGNGLDISFVTPVITNTPPDSSIATFQVVSSTTLIGAAGTTYSSVSTTASNYGVNATFDITRDVDGSILPLTMITPGSGYQLNEVLTIDGSLVGGLSGVDDITIQVIGLQPNAMATPPYSSTAVNPYTYFWNSRYRQGILGAGLLEPGDVKIDAVIDQPMYQPPYNAAEFRYSFSSPFGSSYPIDLTSQIFPLKNLYRDIQFIDGASASYAKFDRDIAADGGIFKLQEMLYAAITNTLKLKIVYFSGNPTGSLLEVQKENLNFSVFPNKLTYTSARIFPAFNIPLIGPSVGDVFLNHLQDNFDLNNISGKKMETYLLKGGTKFVEKSKEQYSFSKISDAINNGIGTVKYYYVKNVNGVTQFGEANDYALRMVSADLIEKQSRKFFQDDVDKPVEYTDASYIGNLIVDTNEKEVVYRHRGRYEPKTSDVVSFCLRETEDFTRHFQADFLLRNTRINELSRYAGIVRNVNFNKVADNEILKIARTSSYKSLYPKIGEVSIDHDDRFVLDSSWDDAYFRLFTNTLDSTPIEGIREMQEVKSYLAGKAMVVPNAHTIETFLPSEAAYHVSQENKSIGVAHLAGADSATGQQSLSDADKPRLIVELDLRSRLLRKLKEDMSLSGSMDEFAWMQGLSPQKLSSLSNAQIEELKDNYLIKNILPLYKVNSITLYALGKEGISIFDASINDATKASLGYRVDKNFTSLETGNLKYQLTKVLDTKKFFGFSLSAVIGRI